MAMGMMNLKRDNYKGNMELVKALDIIDPKMDFRDREDLRNREKTKWS